MGYRIGLILGTKSADYPRMIRLGVQNTLEAHGHTLVCLADLIPYHTHANTECALRVIFELARSLDLDATIVPMGTTCGYLHNDLQKANRMLHLLNPSRTLVMERDVDGYRSVTKDSRTGMAACIRYLIEDAGYRRIAFISGSASSKGARDRESAYFDQMASHGLTIPEGYFVRGDFSGNCRDVVEQLIDGHPDIEAIACASDQIAFVVYHVMHKRRLEVGRDIAVTGFDGHLDAEHLDPPLATVNMTGYDFGCIAAREAIRLCEGLPQLETTQTGNFIARESCGVHLADNVSRALDVLSKRPLPMDEVVSMLMDASFRMANADLTARFRAQLETLVTQTRASFERHLADLDADVELVSSSTLSRLFSLRYHRYFSLEGFHAVYISLLKALARIHPEQSAWLAEQESILHLHVARLLDANNKMEVLGTHLREWRTLHLTEDALREDERPQEAYRLMLTDLKRIGARWADLYLLPDAVDVMDSTSLALPETIQHVGSLHEGEVDVEQASQVPSQGLMSHSLDLHGEAPVCSIGGILAGDELMGFLAMDGGTLDDNGQLIAMINMGLALKHLQTMASIREMNDILSHNNLYLARQSMRDEMTGLLNRRGLHDGAIQEMRQNAGKQAAIMYMDLDGLKYINDTFGHDAGDVAIRATARVLQESLPDDSMLARMGGDEFVAFLLGTSQSEAEGYITAIESALKRANARRDVQAMPFELQISVGVASFAITADLKSILSDAMAQADERMYRTKKRHHLSRGYRTRTDG